MDKARRNGSEGSPGKPGFFLLLVLALAVAVNAPPRVAAGDLFRGVPQPKEITDNPRENFLYGSIGAESNAGIPYWIIAVLPRIFPQYLPGPGGYASLGLPWEEGKEFPSGFSKKTVIFPRVGFNCALCHSTQYRTAPEAKPVVVAGGGSNTADIQGLLDFFSKAASDPRFNAHTILTEVDAAYPLRWSDRLLYRFVLIPLTRRRLIAQGRDFAWTASRPRWGPGRDAPMNLTKFAFLHMQADDSIDHTDFPAIWHLAAREQEGRNYDGKPPGPHSMLMNLDGATTSFRSVLIDSALGLGATNTPFFRSRIPQLLDWLRELRPPPYPLPAGAQHAQQAALGQTVFEAQCASCHAPNRDNRMGTVIPIEEIGTDRERLDAWRKTDAATRANEKVASLGIQRTPMITTNGYIAVQLDGIWLRGPFLHNGSVPTVRALLAPSAERPKVFCRGYDVIDPDNLGFISDARVDPRCAEEGPPAKPSPWDRPGTPGRSNEWPQPRIWKYYVAERGNGNGGHEYGTQLSAQDKDALIEYLKTL